MAIYDIVVADARSPRDGKFIEKLGQYNPGTTPAGINLKEDRALYWLMVGAQPTDTAKKVLSVKGVMLKKHLQVGVEKGAITQEDADKKHEAWLEAKAKVREEKLGKLSSSAAASKAQALEAEKKKKEEMLAKRAEAEAAAVAAVEAENNASEDEATEVEESTEENTATEE